MSGIKEIRSSFASTKRIISEQKTIFGVSNFVQKLLSGHSFPFQNGIVAVEGLEPATRGL